MGTALEYIHSSNPSFRHRPSESRAPQACRRCRPLFCGRRTLQWMRGWIELKTIAVCEKNAKKGDRHRRMNMQGEPTGQEYVAKCKNLASDMMVFPDSLWKAGKFYCSRTALTWRDCQCIQLPSYSTAGFSQVRLFFSFSLWRHFLVPWCNLLFTFLTFWWSWWNLHSLL